MGFYNYSSPRLLQEAKDPVIEVSNIFAKTYSSLLAAHRSDAVQLNLQAERYKEDLRKAQEEIAEKTAEIARLRERYSANMDEP